MSASIPDGPPPASQSAARRDRPFVLAVAALLVAATAVGIGVAVAVLPDGVHHALIRKVDVAGDRVTVDVVQRFVGDAATKAAIEDGRSPQEAEDTIVWLRNENPRLRTLPLAAGLRVDFFEPCDTAPDRRAVLRRLAANAHLGQYFYSLTVRHGSVHALVERQITPAC